MENGEIFQKFSVVFSHRSVKKKKKKKIRTCIQIFESKSQQWFTLFFDIVNHESLKKKFQLHFAIENKK